MEFTPNLNLPKPADGEDGWGDEMRTAMDTLDAMIAEPDRVLLSYAAGVQEVPNNDYSYRAKLDTVTFAQLGDSLAYDLDVGVDHHAAVTLLKAGVYTLTLWTGLFPNTGGFEAWAVGFGLDPNPAEAGAAPLVFAASNSYDYRAHTIRCFFPADTVVTLQIVNLSTAPEDAQYPELKVMRG